MDLKLQSSIDLYQYKYELEKQLEKITNELILRGEVFPPEEPKQSFLSPLTILTAPGAVNIETWELIREQYGENSALVLTDGLSLRLGEVIDGTQILYILAPTFISIKDAKKIKKQLKANLKRLGYTDFKVIVLGDGINPVVLE